MIAVVVVEWCSRRPPTAQHASRVVVEAETETEARLIACQVVEARSVAKTVRAKDLAKHGVWMSTNIDVVMAVSATIVDIIEI